MHINFQSLMVCDSKEPMESSRKRSALYTGIRTVTCINNSYFKIRGNNCVKSNPNLWENIVNMIANNICIHINPFICSPDNVIPINEKLFIRIGIDIVQISGCQVSEVSFSLIYQS